MTAQPLAPVIPPSAIPAAHQHGRSAGGRPLPLARLEPVPSVPDEVVYGIGRIDASDRAVTSALGWQGGDRLTLTADACVITARRDPGGMITMPGRAYIAIPAALRRRCGLRPGDRVLLASKTKTSAASPRPPQNQAKQQQNQGAGVNFQPTPRGPWARPYTTLAASVAAMPTRAATARAREPASSAAPSRASPSN